MGLVWIFKKLLWGNAFSTERGRIMLFGRMIWTLFPCRALALNLQTIGDRLGEEFVYQLGYEAGRDVAQELVRYMGLRPWGGWATQKAVISLPEFIGFGKPEFVHAKIRGRHHHRACPGPARCLAGRQGTLSFPSLPTARGLALLSAAGFC